MNFFLHVNGSLVRSNIWFLPEPVSKDNRLVRDPRLLPQQVGPFNPVS